ncbi:glycosyltransferase [Ferrovibrio sp.]|uniref:glycosyltransferase n=1 Tax=Ferrovibrio sp. TaxID=1917215 RepID=UPI0025B8530C|nr:glycosyltransferase [Ferrovibrio sp.]MBX3454267.1 glycosyltransferase [Ferrovibrio sp.]
MTIEARSTDSDQSSAVPSRRPSVTILLSNYNQGHYLRSALDGIVGQFRPADEIILVDDGSTDNSRAIMAEYVKAHPRIRFMQNESNIGLQATIERVLPLITTTHMVWTASDDRLLPDFLTESMPVLERHPEAGLCFSETVELRGTDPSNELAVRFATTPGVAHIFNLGDLPEMLDPAAVVARMQRAYLPIAGNTAVVDCAKLRAIGGFVNALEWHSDLVAYTILTLRHGACVVAKPLAYIRANPQSYSYTGMRSPAKLREVQEEMLKLFSKRDFRDIRRALRRAPAFFSVWGKGIMPVMARRMDWDLLLPYATWWLREYKRGHRIGWGEIIRRAYNSTKYRLTTPRAIRARLSGAEMERDAGRQQIAQLTAERDAARAERDVAQTTLGQRTAERDGAANALLELRTAHEQVLARLAETERNLEVAYNTIAAADTRAADLSGAFKRILAERDDIFKQLQKLLARQSSQDKVPDLTARLQETERQLAAHRAEAEARLAAANAQADAQFAAAKAEATALQNQIAAQQAELEHLRQTVARIKLPPMLVTTMPKSGTYFISGLFEAGLKIDSRIVSHQYFPDDVIRQPELRILSEGNCISQDHFGASRINLTHIARHVDRIMVHLRDPRQATLSYVHYLADPSFRANEAATLKFVYPPLPADFYSLPFEQRLDWGIDHWLPLLIEWVDGWLRAEAEAMANGGTLRIGFTRFEDMAADQEAFIGHALEFFGIPAERFIKPPLKAEDVKHFRRGEVDEWRRVFSSEQAARATRLIPPAMAERFSWPLGQ